jgi:hypothetical protein
MVEPVFNFQTFQFEKAIKELGQRFYTFEYNIEQ